jgi:NAD(P)-dependent dehydrogenase (short-subunit alcohol dehydrogenase family)
MKLALITGGQQGIGLGIAKALAGAGFRIMLAAEQLEAAAADALATLPADTVYLRHDITRIDRVEGLLDQVEALAGPVTTFVSNAGVPAIVRGDLFDMSSESFDRCMAVNLRGAFFLAQAVARRMAAVTSDHYRSLSFITSVSAEMVSPDRAEYCISKAGASMMAKAFALRLAPLNIGVFELRPGIIETAMTAAVKAKYDPQIAAGVVPARRWGQPADIGSVIVPLVLGQMAFATGAVIPVDGALSVPRL